MNIRAAIALIAASLAFAALDCRATDLTVGVHTVSAHLPAKAGQNNSNCGAYIRTQDWQLGGYHNTHDRTTAYVARIVPVGPVEILVGAATGYQKRCQSVTVETGTYTKVTINPDGSKVTEKGKTFEERESCKGFSRGAVTPLLTIAYSAPFEVLGATPRVWIVPPTKNGSAVVHLSMEWSLR